MFSPFICGSFTHPEEEDIDIEPWSPGGSTPRRSSRCRNRDTKNPYSNRGLDKFSALLADLDNKRQKIYTQRGSEDISFVRFVYSNSNDCKPIVVKMREKKQDKIPTTHNSEAKNLIEKSSKAGNDQIQEAKMEAKDQKMRFTRNFMNLGNWRRPSYYLPVIIIFILVFLAVFGRSFAILCTSLGWYLVPTIKGGSSNSKRPKKKQEHERRLSDGKIESEGKHGHRRSW